MYIDDFIWLPDILEKLAVNTMSPKMKLRRCFSTVQGIVSLNQDTDQVKMYTRPAVKLTQGDI
jgi:hypothetical protein